MEYVKIRFMELNELVKVKSVNDNDKSFKNKPQITIVVDTLIKKHLKLRKINISDYSVFIFVLTLLYMTVIMLYYSSLIYVLN